MQTSESGMVFSDMTFKDFGKDNCFQIEESKLYKSLKHLGFKTVEFVAYRAGNHEGDCRLLFVEAKTTLRSEKDMPRFSDEIADISQKFIDALQIVCGAWHGGKKNTVKLPDNFTQFRENGKKIVFILVVKNSGKEELLTVADAISRQLLKEIRLWKFEVKVFNEELAKKENLILGDM